MPWWVWLLPLAGMGALLWRLLKQPQYYRHIQFNQLANFVERFVSEGEAGSVLLLEREGNSGLLQVKLKDPTDAAFTVEIGLPEVDWSTEQFDRIEAQLREAGCAIRVDGGRGCSTVRRFLRAAVSGDEDAAVAGAKSGIAIVGAELGWQAASFTVHNEVSWRSRFA